MYMNFFISGLLFLSTFLSTSFLKITDIRSLLYRHLHHGMDYYFLHLIYMKQTVRRWRWIIFFFFKWSLYRFIQAYIFNFIEKFISFLLLFIYFYFWTDGAILSHILYGRTIEIWLNVSFVVGGENGVGSSSSSSSSSSSKGDGRDEKDEKDDTRMRDGSNVPYTMVNVAKRVVRQIDLYIYYYFFLFLFISQ